MQMLLPPPHIVLGGVGQGIVEFVISFIHHVPIPVSLLQCRRRSKGNMERIKFMHQTWPEGVEMSGRKSLVQWSSPCERHRRPPSSEMSHLGENYGDGLLYLRVSMAAHQGSTS